MRIAVVNDVPLVVEALSRILHSGGHHVAWTAARGEDALAACQQDRPDLILMDLVMPGWSGAETTRRIMAETPVPILVVTVDVRVNGAQVYEAMGAGAVDAVETPPFRGTRADAARLALLEKIRAILQTAQGPASSMSRPRRAATRQDPPLVLVGASTGGPQALQDVLGHLPASPEAAVVAAQHIDHTFAPGLGRWLDSQITVPVSMARPGQSPVAGTVALADASASLAVGGDACFAHRPGIPGHHHCPEIDVLFESALAHWQGPLCAVLLTGMGQDGAAGLLALRRAGHTTIAQDAASCAVDGMPRAARERGAAQHVLALEQIGPWVTRWIRRQARPRRERA